MNLLPDTSIWIDYLRGRDEATVAELDRYLERQSVFTCGPVMAELMAGTAPDRRDDLWLAIGSLPWAEIDQPAWRSIGEVANDLRRAGVSVPLTDIAIAVAAADAEAPLWTNDRDFQRIQEVFPALELHADIGEAIVQGYTPRPQAEDADEELGEFPPPDVDRG